MSPATPPSPGDKAKRALAAYQESVASIKRRDIEKALRALRKANGDITVASVARHAGVSRKTVYKHPDLVAVIDQYRHTVLDEPRPNSSAETSVVQALRRKIRANEDTIKELREALRAKDETIALLYGQLDQREQR